MNPATPESKKVQRKRYTGRVKEKAALVITDFWGKILATLIAGAISGGIVFALDIRSTQDIVGTKVDALQQAQLPPRIDKLEVKVDNVNKTLDEMQQTQHEQNQKLDMLINRLITFPNNNLANKQ